MESQEITEMHDEISIINKKIRILRKSHAIETDVLNKFKIENQIKEAISDREYLKNEMVALQKKLQNSTDNLGIANIDNKLFSDWGEAPDINSFYGRESELETLKKWITEDRCRLVLITGLKGIGKTKLSVKLGKAGIGKTDLSLKIAHTIQTDFKFIIFRRLLNAPPISDILVDIIRFISNQQDIDIPKNINSQIYRLLLYLKKNRCLIILDNIETILNDAECHDFYKEGCAEYGDLFKQIGETSHQSCFLLTSREKPKEVAILEGANRPVRTFELGGINKDDCEKIYCDIGDFKGSANNWEDLVKFYSGNPLALELAAKHIQEVFFGEIRAFLTQGRPIFKEFRELLDWHFNRLSRQEKEIMYWLAINREPVTYMQLKDDLVSTISKENLPSNLQYIQRRIPLEKTETRFTIQPVLIEYITDKFINKISQELVNRDVIFNLFDSHAIIKALTKDYIRESQKRLILEPIINSLICIYKDFSILENVLVKLIETIREKFSKYSGYSIGNIITILCRIKNDNISGYDLSGVNIKQVYFQNVNLQNVNLSYSNIEKSLFTDTFGSILSLSYNPKLDILATGSGKGEIRLWNIYNGEQMINFTGHKGWVRSIAFSPNGNFLISGSNDKAICVWDIEKKQLIKKLYGHTDWVRSVIFCTNRIFASCSNDKTIRIWDFNSCKCIKVLTGHSNWVNAIAFSSDGRFLISGSRDKTVILWDLNTFECDNIFRGHLGQVRSVSFSPGDSLIASGSSDNNIMIWDKDKYSLKMVLKGHTDRVRTIVFGKNDNLLASGSNDKTIRLWNISTGQCIKTLHGHNNWIESITFANNSDILISGSSDQTIKVWDISNGHCVKTLYGHINPVRSVSFAPSSGIIASGNEDQTVQLWDINSGRCLKVLKGHTNWVWTVSFSKDSNFIASGSGDNTVRIWDVKSGNCTNILSEHNNRVRTVCFDPVNNFLASGGGDNIIKIWDIKKGVCIKELRGHTNWIQSLSFSPKGNILASASGDYTIRIWDVINGKCLKIAKGHKDWVNTVHFSYDGLILASGSSDQTLCLWDVSSGKRIKKYGMKIDRISSLAFCPKSYLLAICGQSNHLYTIDINIPKKVNLLKGHNGIIWTVSFDASGQIIATGSEDETIKIWNVNSNKCIMTLKSNRPYEQMNIKGITGLTTAQKESIKLLGAVDF